VTEAPLKHASSAKNWLPWAIGSQKVKATNNRAGELGCGLPIAGEGIMRNAGSLR